MPVISVHTQARHEGYFRREWKQAVERTHDMAEGVPFVVPVVVDETVDAGAVVPGEFLRVQWTRLPGALPTQEFVEQVKLLLEGPRKSRAPSGMPFSAGDLKATGSHPPRGIPGWVWGAAAGIAAAAVVYILVSRKPEAPTVPAPVATLVVAAVATPAPAVPKIDEKSIAVLPFANMSEEKDNEFFAEGIQDDILTNLALLHELHVVSRTSVMQYRETTKSIGQIASELGVAYILEGSVRREGNKVRVTGQLIHAATDEHVWAKAYDRDLTDIFSIQSELAQDIAGELKAAIAPEERVSLDRRPTENTEAYDLYLRARAKSDARTDDMDEKVVLLQKAVELDPLFARAWGELARSYAYGAFHFQTGTDELAEKAKAASDRSVQLAPDDPDVISKLGDYYYYAHRDYAKANEEYQRLARQRPNDAVVFSSLGLIQRRQGRWAESLANLHRATELDVANKGYLFNLISSLSLARRYDEMAAAWRKMVALKPDDIQMSYQLALTSFLASGSTKEVEAFLANLTPDEFNSPKGISIRADWAGNIGDEAEIVRLMRLQTYFDGADLSHSEQDVMAATVYSLRGDQAAAIARLGHMPDVLSEELKREPKNPRLWFLKGRMELVLGRTSDAVSSADRCTQLIPESVDRLEGPLYASFCVAIYDEAGDKDRALSEYARLLRDPGSILNVNQMKHDCFTKLRGDPRFEALINDPANNAPLF